MNPDPSPAPSTPNVQPEMPRVLGDWSFHVFLAVLILTYVISPILTASDDLLPIQRRFTAGIMLTGLVVLKRRHLDWVIGLVLLLPALVADALDDKGTGGVHIVGQVASICYLLFLAGLIIHHIFTARRVTLGTISAALCLYLVMAFAWGGAYDLADSLETAGSFDGILAGGTEMSLLDRQQRDQDLQYFSVVTITTLGYGDITPTSGLTRGLASLEAFFGQMFLAVLVARLVSLYTMESRRSKEKTSS